MFMMFMICMLIFAISMFVMLLASLISKKNIFDREKNSPFECGFDPKSSTRIPFSLHFFLITIIFLIFDVEIALIIPMILTINYSNLFIWSISNFLFILILLLGLYHEWNQGALNWSS